jgi:hypothetical protein
MEVQQRRIPSLHQRRDLTMARDAHAFVRGSALSPSPSPGQRMLAGTVVVTRSASRRRESSGAQRLAEL